MNDQIFEPTPQEPIPGKPNPFIQLFKGLAYFLLFIAAQVITIFMLTIYFYFDQIAQNTKAGITMPVTQISALVEEKVVGSTHALLIIYSILFFLTLLLVFAIRRKNFFRELRLNKISVSYLPGLLLLALGLILFIDSVLNLLPRSVLEGYTESSSSLSQGAFALSMLTQALIAPLTEEVTFRGLLLSRFNKALPRWVGILISSFLFGLVHGQIVWFIYAAFLGIIFSLIANHMDSILGSILLHMLFNAGGTMIAYVPFPLILPVLIGAAIAGTLLIIFSLWLIFRKPAASVQ